MNAHTMTALVSMLATNPMNEYYDLPPMRTSGRRMKWRRPYTTKSRETKDQARARKKAERNRKRDARRKQ